MAARRVLHFGVLMLLLAPQPAASQWATSALPDRDYVVMSRFLTAVDAYVVEHHRLFEPLSEDMMCLPEDTLAKMNTLAEVPREARRPPREGEMFTPDAAELFRRLIFAAFYGDEDHGGDLLAQIGREALLAPPIYVNQPPPSGTSNGMPGLVAELPPLPDELEYRFIGRHLVIVDVPANLVVDIIRDALPMY